MLSPFFAMKILDEASSSVVLGARQESLNASNPVPSAPYLPL